MLAKELIKILEKNPESEITLSIQNNSDSRRGYVNYIDEVTNSGKTVTIVGVIDEPHLFEDMTKDKLLSCINSIRTDNLSNEEMTNYILKYVYKNN